MKHVITFTGHENIRSLHKRTIEITKDEFLTPSGDCIVGVNASHACSDIPSPLKLKLKDSSNTVKLTIQVNDYEFTITGKGHAKLLLEHDKDIVIRKSEFVCPRTLAIKCNKSSDQIPREMVEELQNPNTKGKFIIEVK